MADPSFTCPHCKKKYRRKIYFDNHVNSCRLISISKYQRTTSMEEMADLPSVRELFSLVQELSTKYEKVSNELTELKKYVDKTKRQLSISDWLDENHHCDISFRDWIRNLQVSREHLLCIFTDNFVDGFFKIVKEGSEVSTDVPMKCFDQKKSVFFIYDTNWRTMNKFDYEFMFNCINSKIIKEFKKWQQDNISLLSSDSDTYQSNVMKVLGGGTTSLAQTQSRVRTKLYQSMKYNLKQIIEFEFT